jgi:hypothetical protein
MLREYLGLYRADYPFPQPKIMSQMWRRARDKAATNHNDPTLKNIPMKNLRNYSGAQFYLNYEKDAIGTMRHLRHKRLETTMHYLRAIVLDAEPEYICNSQNHRRRHTTNQRRIPVRHRKRRDQTLPKTQITPLFLFNIIWASPSPLHQ